MLSSIEDYERKKKVLVRQLQYNKGRSIGLEKKNSNLFRKRSQKGTSRINVKNFNKVISVNRAECVAEVEGMTTFDDFVKETLRFGFMPPVVPQLKSITIGGAVSGIGIESSSFRYGLVHETVKEMEILLGNGEVITCTPTNKYKDLFFALPNSYGTLGYILKLKVKLVPVKEYVEIKHLKYSDPKKYFADLKNILVKNRALKKNSYDFVDGAIFSGNEMYITLGKFADSAPYTSDYTYMGVYYLSLRKNKKDWLTIQDYIWRWDPDWFWESGNFMMDRFIPRLLLGKFMLNSYAYWKIISIYRGYGIEEKARKIAKLFGVYSLKESIVQDVCVPLDNCGEFLDFFTKEIGITPIWICPFKSFDKNAVFELFNPKPSLFYVDFGFWNSIPTTKEDGHYNRLIEEKVEELKGLKSLYSTSYYPEKKFWRLYNGKKYWSLKRKYDSKGIFKDLFEKCVKGR